MLINKITTGFVIQTFDTEKQEYVQQRFVAGDGDQVDYETTDGEMLVASSLKQHGFGPLAEPEPYLPFDMLQPSEMAHFGEKLGDKKS